MAKISYTLKGADLAAKFAYMTERLYQEVDKTLDDFGEVAVDKAAERLRTRTYARYQDHKMNETMPVSGNPRGTQGLGDSIEYEKIGPTYSLGVGIGQYLPGSSAEIVGIRLKSDHPAARIVEEGGVVHHPGVDGKLVVFSGYGYVPYATWRGPGRIKDGKFNVGDYSRLVGGGTSYQFGYNISQLALTPLGQAVYAWKVKPHDIPIEAKHYMHNTLVEMAPRFKDMIRGAVRKAFDMKAPEIKPGLRKGPGNVPPTNTHSSGNI